jgi:pimeloyl-ACP methyl ester carboxylesterase
MGGFISPEIALSYPDIVDRLVLVATGMGRCPLGGTGPAFLGENGRGDHGEISSGGYRIDLTLMTAPGFAEERPDVVEKAVALRMQNPQPLYAFLRQFAAAACLTTISARRSHPSDLIIWAGDPLFPIELARISERPCRKLK